MRKLLIIFLFFTFANSLLLSQSNYDENKKSPDASDYIISAGEVFYINLTIAVGSSIVTNQPLVIFNWDNIKEAFSLPLIWDNSSFFRNQLAHPYFGSLYFNAARSNNIDFLQSVLYTATGSFMWETIIENGNISLNDLITTTIDGSITGEILYRLSCEAFGFFKPLSWIINPFGSLNNFIRGQDFSSTNNINSFYVSMGTGLPAYIVFPENTYNDKTSLTLPNFNGKIYLIYNTPFAHKSKEFLDQFDLSFSFNISNEFKIFDLSMNGLLYGIPIYFDSYSLNTLGIDLSYNVFYSNKMFFSNSKTGIIFYEKLPINKYNLSWSTSIDYIFPSTVDKYYELFKTSPTTENRNYTYYHGFSSDFNIIFEEENQWKLSLSNKLKYLLPVIIDDKERNHFINNTTLSFEYFIYNNFYLGTEDNLIFKRINYKNGDQINQFLNNFNIYLGYKIK